MDTYPSASITIPMTNSSEDQALRDELIPFLGTDISIEEDTPYHRRYVYSRQQITTWIRTQTSINFVNPKPGVGRKRVYWLGLNYAPFVDMLFAEELSLNQDSQAKGIEEELYTTQRESFRHALYFTPKDFTAFLDEQFVDSAGLTANEWLFIRLARNTFWNGFSDCAGLTHVDFLPGILIGGQQQRIRVALRAFLLFRGDGDFNSY